MTGVILDFAFSVNPIVMTFQSELTPLSMAYIELINVSVGSNVYEITVPIISGRLIKQDNITQ